MDIATLPHLFTPLDAVAALALFTAWIATTFVIEWPWKKRPSLSVLMTEYRRAWMRETPTREPRVYDAMMITSIRQATTFFASTTMIALGGGLALIANIDRLADVTADLALNTAPPIALEVKLVAVLFLVLNAFLKFVWSHRVFGYCAVMMASVPNDAADPRTAERVEQAADLNILAARSFNRGLRSVYFALGALTWLFGAVPLLVAVAATVMVLLRREFASETRATLVRDAA